MNFHKQSKTLAQCGVAFGILFLLGSAALVIFKLESYAHIAGVLCGLGTSLLVGGALYLYRAKHHPEKIHQLEVAQNDERNHMIRGKAGVFTFVVTTLLLAALEITCFLIGERTAAVLTIGVMFAHVLCFMITGTVLNKKL